jgi:uncharacterized CHY-type Zn-finger protein
MATRIKTFALFAAAKRKSMQQSTPETKVKGSVVDRHTRCVHYHSELDVIAIKFKCCGDYYPCYSCHKTAAGHEAQVWPQAEWNTKAILCGMCSTELTINQYLQCGNTCPHCAAHFNPGCSKHYGLYFEATGGNGQQ